MATDPALTQLPPLRSSSLFLSRSELLKTFIVPLCFPFLSIIDRAFISVARSLRRSKFSDDIIFIRTDNLGDFILWLATASALRNHWPWPGRRFVLIANASWVDLARSLKIFDEVVPIDRKSFQRNPGYRFASLYRLAGLRAELLVNPIHSRDPVSADTIARAVSAKRKVAARGDTSNSLGLETLTDNWYSELINSTDVSVHEALRNRDFLARFCGIQTPDPWPRLGPPPHSSVSIELPKTPYAVIAPGAAAARRVWPPSMFAQLAARIARETSLEIVLVASRSELPLANEVERLCSVRLLNLAGKLSLLDLLSVVSEAKLVLTNETGTAHLGAAFRIPTVCVLGGGHPGRFVPYPPEAGGVGIRIYPVCYEMSCFGCNWRCIYRQSDKDAVPCIANISADSVWQAVELALTPVARQSEAL